MQVQQKSKKYAVAIAVAVSLFSGLYHTYQSYHAQPNNSVSDSKGVSEWDYHKNPLYYRVLGKANLNPSDFPTKGIEYGGLDSLGRATTVKATVSYSMFENARGHQQSFAPSEYAAGYTTQVTGKTKTWNAVLGKVQLIDGDGKGYRGWFYNNSHLVGDALGGESSKRNAITGTRFQNVGSRSNKGGMRYTESKVEKYFKSKGRSAGKVYYKVVPSYNGSELLPRTVSVYVQTQDGTTINEAVETSNTAQGYKIDYNTGKFSKE